MHVFSLSNFFFFRILWLFFFLHFLNFLLLEFYNNYQQYTIRNTNSLFYCFWREKMTFFLETSEITCTIANPWCNTHVNETTDLVAQFPFLQLQLLSTHVRHHHLPLHAVRRLLLVPPSEQQPFIAPDPPAFPAPGRRVALPPLLCENRKPKAENWKFSIFDFQFSIAAMTIGDGEESGHSGLVPRLISSCCSAFREPFPFIK